MGNSLTVANYSIQFIIISRMKPFFWQKHFETQEDLEKFLKFLRRKGVSDFKMDGVSITLKDRVKKIKQSNEKPRIEAIPALSPEEQKKEDELNLFWSTG